MTPFEGLQFAVTIFLAVVTARQAYVTHQLERRLYRLNTNLDQSIQRLHRAREAVIQEHKAEIFLRQYMNAQKERVAEKSDIYFEKHAELSAYSAELRGLALAIGDEKLLSIVDRSPSPPASSDNLQIRETDARIRAEDLHARISKLLLDATADSQTAKQDGDWRTV